MTRQDKTRQDKTRQEVNCINLYLSNGKETSYQNRVYNTNYVCTALTAGYRVLILEEVKKMSKEIKVDMLGMLDIKGDEQIRRGYKPDGLAPTLNTMQGGNRQPKIMIKENNKQGFSELEVPGVADLSFSVSSTRRERTQDGGKTCPTLDTCATGLTVIEEVKTGAIRGRGDKGEIKQKLEINNEEYINTLTTVQKDNVLLENEYRIRKLTPRECWRLMGFYDEDFNNAAQVCSNTQLYKQAGNSIVVDVLEAIFKNLIEG